MKMYKITLFDQNCGACVSGTASFFVEDIKEFEEYWINNPRVDEEQKERYKKSKAGKLVSDYYVTSEDLNIFQYDEDAKILQEFRFEFEDKEFVLHNFFEYESILYARKAEIRYRQIRFKGDYYWIGRYKLLGVCRDFAPFGWSECTNYGNEILELKLLFNGRDKLGYEKELFAEDSAETYCWISLAKSKEPDRYSFTESDLISEEMLDSLMRDIVGDAG